MKKACVIACALLVCASTAGADVVVDWNVRAAQSIGSGGRRGPSGAIDFAMVHAAMHDAIQAFQGRFEPYCAAIPGATGSPVAAAVAAAHGVLIGLFPSDASREALNASYDASLAKYGVTGDTGVTVGQQAAKCLLDRLAADNIARAQPDTFVGGHAAGEWRPTSFTPAGSEVAMIAEFMCTVAPFTLKSADQFRASQGPPHLTSGAYAKNYNEVKTLGALVGSTRTQEQTNIGLFYSDGPVAYWTGALRSLADTHLNDIGDSARLFALTHMAMADSLITAWDSKLAWNFWRPITAIRNGDADGNPRTAGDTGWLPLRGTPNYPDYTSGANSQAGAVTAMLANFFGGDELDFSLKSTTIAAPDNVRQYSSLAAAAQDVVDARIYMGIHFRFADTVALTQGKHVANWVFGHFLRPIGNNDE
jgi:hypothetical protein